MSLEGSISNEIEKLILEAHLEFEKRGEKLDPKVKDKKLYEKLRGFYSRYLEVIGHEYKLQPEQETCEKYFVVI